MSEITTYRVHGTEGMLKSIGGDWVKWVDHASAVSLLSEAAEQLTKQVSALVDESAPPQSNFIVATIAAEALVKKLESEKKMLRAGECPECEKLNTIAAEMDEPEPWLSGIVALANGAVVKLRFPEDDLERFVEMMGGEGPLLQAIVTLDGWSCELLSPGPAPQNIQLTAETSRAAYGPHYPGTKPAIRTCGRCGESGPLDVMRCKCEGEEPQPGRGTGGTMEEQICAVHGVTRVTVVQAPELSGPSARVVRITVWTEGAVDTGNLAQAIHDATPDGVDLAGETWAKVPDQDQDVVGWTYGEPNEGKNEP